MRDNTHLFGGKRVLKLLNNTRVRGHKRRLCLGERTPAPREETSQGTMRNGEIFSTAQGKSDLGLLGGEGGKSSPPTLRTI